jgi:transposase
MPDIDVMQATDMRSLSRDARHERRVQVIRLRERGYSYEDIAQQTGLSRTGVFDICKRWRRLGDKGLRDAPGGRPAGEGRALDLTQELLLRELIACKTPEELQLPWALWTRAAVGQLIGQYCAVALSVRAVGLYLARWGFTPQKPLTQAREQSPAAVSQWLEEDYPKIAARARAEGAEIHWGDETGLRSDDVRGRGYAPRGQTPAVRVSRKRQGLSVISTVTNKGQMRWRVFDGGMNGPRLIDFMQRLVREVGKKVFLILDNLRAHHAKPVKAWLAANAERIEVFYLPSYSPELNPDEMANADLKQAVTKRVPARTKQELAKAVTSHLRSVQRQPERVKKYFQHEPVRYAA